MIACACCKNKATYHISRRSLQDTSIGAYAAFVPDLNRFDRDIYECGKCGLQFIHPMYTAEDFKILYDGEGYQKFRDAQYTMKWEDATKDNPAFVSYVEILKDKFTRLGLNEFVQSFRKINGKKPTALDVGCGEGYNLYALDQMGFEVHGLDMSKKFITSIRERWGYDVKNMSLEDKQDDEKYDAVFAFHLIEHMDDPNALFKSASKMLNSHGILVIETPYAEDFGKTAQRFRDIYHTIFFDHFSLAFVAARNSFYPIKNYHVHFYAGNFYHTYMTGVFQHQASVTSGDEHLSLLRPIFKNLIEDGREWGHAQLDLHRAPTLHVEGTGIIRIETK